SPFAEKIPAPRRVTDEERAVFDSLQGILNQMQPEEKLTPEVIQQLKEIKIPTGDGNKTVGADQLVSVLQKLNDSHLLQTLSRAEVPVLPDKVITNPKYSYMLLT